MENYQNPIVLSADDCGVWHRLIQISAEHSSCIEYHPVFLGSKRPNRPYNFLRKFLSHFRTTSLICFGTIGSPNVLILGIVFFLQKWLKTQLANFSTWSCFQQSVSGRYASCRHDASDLLLIIDAHLTSKFPFPLLSLALTLGFV